MATILYYLVFVILFLYNINKSESYIRFWQFSGISEYEVKIW